MVVFQLCPALCNPMDSSLPGFSVHGILQARILEWVAIPFSRGSSWPRDRTLVSCIGRRVLYHWATIQSTIMNKSGRVSNTQFRWDYFGSSEKDSWQSGLFWFCFLEQHVDKKYKSGCWNSRFVSFRTDGWVFLSQTTNPPRSCAWWDGSGQD